MPRFSHTSDGFSSPDENNNRHKLSLDSMIGRKNGDNYTTYEARTNSEWKFGDPRHDMIVIAKFPKCGHGSNKWTMGELEKVRIAQISANRFNEFWKHIKNEDYWYVMVPITFLNLQQNTLTSVSGVNRSRIEGEEYIFEDKIKGFQTFATSEGCFIEKPQKKCRRNVVKNIFRKNRDDMFTRPRSKSDSLVVDVMRKEKIEEDIYVHDMSSSSTIKELCRGIHCHLPTYEESEHYLKYGVWSYGAPVNMELEIGFDHFAEELPKQNLPYRSTTPGRGRSISMLPSSPDVSLDRDRSMSTDSDRDRSMSTDSSDSCDSSDICSSRRGRRGSSSECMAHPLLQAFMHKFVCDNSGNMVISSLRGCRKADGSYVLSTPTIHTIWGNTNDSDGGTRAMRQVIGNHTCSKYCQHLPDMSDLLDRRLGIK